MNVNSSSSYSVSGSLTASNSNAITGLASGLDTDSVVEEMLSGIKAKIESKEAEKQQTEWKQEMYRDVISTINDFSSSYLDSSYGAETENNLTSEDFFDTMASTSSSSAVSIVSSSSNASEGDMTIEVSQLAEAASVTGSKMSTSYSITGTAIDSDALEQFKRVITFNVTANSSTTSVTVDLGGVSSSSGLVSAINSALEDEGLSSYVTASTDDGSLVLTTADSSSSVSLNETESTTSGLEVAGMTSYVSDTDDDTGAKTLTGSSSIDTSAGVSMTVELDGVQKDITIDPVLDANGDVTTAALLDAVTSSLQSAFGTAIEASYDGDALVLALSADYQSEDGHILSIYGSDASYLGLTAGSTTAFDTSQTLAEMGYASGSEFTINGVSFSFDSDTTVSSLINEVNDSDAGVTLSYSSFSDTFTLEANSTGKAYSISFEETTGSFLNKVLGASSGTAEGLDAQVTINGVTTSRSSNTFTIEGVTMTVNALTSGEETISTARDIDSIVEGITAFVESYNEMLTSLYNYVDADKTYLDYDPLTSDQEDEMTEAQIESWNENAKEGLLHRDTNIDSFLGACRSLMYTKPSSSNFALYQIGIETGDYEDQGILYIDEDALREALSSDPESVKNLFTDSTSGIATTLEDICDDYAKDSYGSTGLLVLEAGIDGGSYDTTNSLSLEISSLEDKIDELQDRYESRRDSLWEKMSNLETALSSYNSTATYLSNMFS